MINDQTIKADAGKLQLSLVPWQIVYDIAEVRKYGNDKYGDSESWKRVDRQRYIDALLRHVLAFAADPESVDGESGIEHYKHAACNMAFLSAMMEGKTSRLSDALGVSGELPDASTASKMETVQPE
jgi:hypothetical protein